MLTLPIKRNNWRLKQMDVGCRWSWQFFSSLSLSIHVCTITIHFDWHVCGYVCRSNKKRGGDDVCVCVIWVRYIVYYAVVIRLLLIFFLLWLGWRRREWIISQFGTLHGWLKKGDTFFPALVSSLFKIDDHNCANNPY